MALLVLPVVLDLTDELVAEINDDVVLTRLALLSGGLEAVVIAELELLGFWFEVVVFAELVVD